jgi:acetyl-CoA acetyltransferase
VDDPVITGWHALPLRREPGDVAALTVAAATKALRSAGNPDPQLILVANALGGPLQTQDNIRGQAWLRDAGLGGAGVINIDNSCAGGSTALYTADKLVRSGVETVLVIGVEQMTVGSTRATVDAIHRAMTPDDRQMYTAMAAGRGTPVMALNARWAREYMTRHGLGDDVLVEAAVRAARLGAANPVGVRTQPITHEHAATSRLINDPLRVEMCSGFADGAAAVVLSATGDGPRITATTMVGGDGTGDYHSRVGDVAARLWTQLGVEARDADVVELHDANASELLWATDVIGITAPGEAAGALTAGRLEPDGDLPAVNPSGGLLGRGHPIGATGVYQLVELAEQVSGLAGSRQRLGADLGALFNCGGIIGEDTAAAVGIAVAGG